MRTIGIGSRVLNFLADTFIIFWIAYIIHHIWRWYVFYYSIHMFNFGVFFALALALYYTFCESIWGRTPGKWLSYSKVVDLQNQKPGLAVILFRSLVRLTVIDPFFIPFLDMPLHDYLSKTRVVEV
ncbi:MAG: RDD family protein [Bacteroidota bacterium]|nr:RDD family protein [Bacteroidota bacterium]